MGSAIAEVGVFEKSEDNDSSGNKLCGPINLERPYPSPPWREEYRLEHRLIMRQAECAYPRVEDSIERPHCFKA